MKSMIESSVSVYLQHDDIRIDLKSAAVTCITNLTVTRKETTISGLFFTTFISAPEKYPVRPVHKLARAELLLRAPVAAE